MSKTEGSQVVSALPVHGCFPVETGASGQGCIFTNLRLSLV